MLNSTSLNVSLSLHKMDEETTPTCTYLSDCPRSLCVHGGVGSPCVGVFPWYLLGQLGSIIRRVERLY